MRGLGLALFGVLGLFALAATLVAVRAGEWAAAVISLLALVWIGAVLDMAMNRTMSPADRERFGPSAAWGGRFFWGVYLRSSRRARRSKRG
jgi:hypothetical protein